MYAASDRKITIAMPIDVLFIHLRNLRHLRKILVSDPALSRNSSADYPDSDFYANAASSAA
jgi:hypothetical protein